MVNASSTVSWTYDALDRRISETQHLAGAAARTVGYAYDEDGNLAALGRPDSTVVAYAYNLRDQLTAVTADGPPPLAQYSYDEMGRRTNLLLENGQNTASTFDTAGRLLAHTHTIGGNPLDAVGYTLDANGWRTAIARPGGKDDAFTYDTTGQVLAATAANTAGPTTESFAYDLASNRTSSTASPPDGVQADTPITYAANSLDQYTSLDGQAQTHDANGNTLLLRQPTQDDVTFDWDSENRMLVQERGGSDPARIVNHYDALHRRVKKEIYEKPGGTFVLVKTHTFIYDGWNVIEERQFNSSGTLTALTRLTWGADLSGSMQGAGGVGGLLMAEEIDLADIDPPTAHYYWYDGNGNVTGITDDTGAIEGTFRYTSFGALAEIATTTAFAEGQPWKFSTKYHDSEVEPVSGTYYYGYRTYLPSVGRWPSGDPIGERGGMNLYGMVGNDAVNRVDLLGLQAPNGGKVGGYAFEWEPPDWPKNETGFFKDMAGGRGKSYVGSGKTGKQLLDHMKSVLPNKNCCIADYRIAGHGWARGKGRGIPSPGNGSNGFMQSKTLVDQSKAGPGLADLHDLRSEITNDEVRFCSTCVIRIYACRISNDFIQKLAMVTKCKVIAAGGACRQLPANPNLWESANGGKPGDDPNWYESDGGGLPVPLGSVYDPN